MFDEHINFHLFFILLIGLLQFLDGLGVYVELSLDGVFGDGVEIEFWICEFMEVVGTLAYQAGICKGFDAKRPSQAE